MFTRSITLVTLLALVALAAAMPRRGMGAMRAMETPSPEMDKDAMESTPTPEMDMDMGAMDATPAPDMDMGAMPSPPTPNMDMGPVDSSPMLAMDMVPADSQCRGSADYEIVFYNMLTPEKFGSLIPDNGLVFSPLAGAAHSNRFSVLTVRGFAIPEVAEIAKTGNNAPLVELATGLLEDNTFISDLAAADGPTMPGNTTTLKLTVDCEHPYVTVLGMIAPSPDWIVQISNKNLYHPYLRDFVSFSAGYLIAYDAGVDDGNQFTDPMDMSLDMPTRPALNIAPLVEDSTDRFEGRPVGHYYIRRMS